MPHQTEEAPVEKKPRRKRHEAKLEVVRLIQAARGKRNKDAERGTPGPLGEQKVRVLHVETPNHGTGEMRYGRRARMATVGTIGTFHSPAARIANLINDALDPVRAPGKCKTLSEMSEDEKAALAAKYGAVVSPRTPQG